LSHVTAPCPATFLDGDIESDGQPLATLARELRWDDSAQRLMLAVLEEMHELEACAPETPKPRQVLDIADARHTLLVIARIVEVIERINGTVMRSVKAFLEQPRRQSTVVKPPIIQTRTCQPWAPEMVRGIITAGAGGLTRPPGRCCRRLLPRFFHGQFAMPDYWRQRAL
jgi:hypothetical protein